jgi:hypothetical protein
VRSGVAPRPHNATLGDFVCSNSYKCLESNEDCVSSPLYSATVSRAQCQKQPLLLELALNGEGNLIIRRCRA